MPKKPISPRSTNDVDLIIAERLRTKRKELGLSQMALAELVGVTFQQVQKYEQAKNRIAASRLFAFANVLGVSLGYFFEPARAQAAKTNKRPAPKAAAAAKGLRV